MQPLKLVCTGVLDVLNSRLDFAADAQLERATSLSSNSRFMSQSLIFQKHAGLRTHLTLSILDGFSDD